MATIIRMIPVGHAGRTTTAVRIEDDGIIVCRTEESGGAVDRRFNFSSYTEGTVVDIAQDPIRSVSVQKLGTDARIIIEVYEYYDQNLKAEEIPEERDLWYSYTTAANMIPSDTLPQGATPSTPVYVLWKSDGTPASPTLPWNINDESTPLARLYARLGSTAERRQYLKDKLLSKYTDPDLNAIMMGSSLLRIVPDSVSYNTPASDPPNNHSYTNQKDHPRANQSMIYRMEMLARAISADVNLDSEAKFNLLDGEISLENWAVFLKVDRGLNGLINPTGNRTDWRFQRLGSVSSSSPYAYTAPSINTGSWTATYDTSINIHNVHQPQN